MSGEVGMGFRLIARAPFKRGARRELRRALGALRRRARGTAAVRAAGAAADAVRMLVGADGLALRGRVALARGAARLRREDHAGALEAADRVAAENPGSGDARALRAEVLRREGRFGEALGAAEEAVTLAPRSARVAKIAGTVALAAADTKRAAEWLARALASDPKDAAVRYNLGRALAAEERFEEALEHIARAIALAPDEAAYVGALAYALRRSGHAEEAVAVFEEALRLRPGSETVIEAFASALIDVGRDAEAIDMVTKRLSEARRAAALARIYLKLRRHDEALAYAEKAVALAPDDPSVEYSRCAALKGVGALTEALASVRRASSIVDEPRFRQQEELILGQLRALSGEWVPTVPGEPRRFEPAARNRVLHLLERTLPHKQNGYAIRSLYTVIAQRQAGLDPVVVTRLGFPRIDGVRSFEPVEDVAGVPHHRIALEGVTDYARIPRDRYLEEYAAAAAGVVERVRPAVLQPASSYFNGLAGLALKRHFGLPMVYEVRGFQEDTWAALREGGDETAYYDGFARTETLIMREADRVVTLAETMRSEIAKRGIDPSRVFVIPNAVDIERFTPRPRNAELVGRLGLEGSVVLGYVSSLVPYEGVDVFLRGLALLVAKGLPVAGLVVGDGPELEPLRGLAHALGIADRVRLPGRVPHDEVLDYYAAIDVFVVPRRNLRVCHLVTPLKPFEAMAMGIPLLVSDVGALHEVAAPPERGLAFVPDSPESLAAEAERLVADETLRRKLGEAGLAWVTRERTWARNAQRYHELYEELLG